MRPDYPALMDAAVSDRWDMVQHQRTSRRRLPDCGVWPKDFD
jgi:hypothetical protein